MLSLTEGSGFAFGSRFAPSLQLCASCLVHTCRVHGNCMPQSRGVLAPAELVSRSLRLAGEGISRARDEQCIIDANPRRSARARNCGIEQAHGLGNAFRV